MVVRPARRLASSRVLASTSGADEIAHLAPDLQRFEHSDPAAIANSAASLASSWLPDGLSEAKPAGLVARIGEKVGFGRGAFVTCSDRTICARAAGQ